MMYMLAGKKLTVHCQKITNNTTTLVSRIKSGISSAQTKYYLGALGQSLNDSSKRGISTSRKMNEKLLTLQTLNPNIKNVEYAVRGPIVQLASKLEKELEQVLSGLFVIS